MWPWFSWQRPPCLLRTVLVVLRSDDDTAIRGVLWQRRGGWFVIREAAVLKGALSPEPIGEAVIAADNVAYFQVLS